VTARGSTLQRRPEEMLHEWIVYRRSVALAITLQRHLTETDCEVTTGSAVDNQGERNEGAKGGG